MGTASNPLVRLAWSVLTAAIHDTLHDFPHLSVTCLRDGVWRIERFGATLDIELLSSEEKIRATRTILNGTITERLFRLTCMRADEPLLADRAGNLASPVVIFDELLEWLAEGNN